MSVDAPLIAIAMNVVEPRPGRLRAECGLAYARRVADAGGRPVFLPPLIDQIAPMLDLCDGFVLTGGDDPRTEGFGQPTDPRTTSVHAARQAFEEQLIAALLARPDIPVLGICLGMQMLALMCGGRLNQYLPATLATAEEHRGDRLHRVHPTANAAGHWLAGGLVASSHKQAVDHPGSTRVLARSHDGVIEAIERPGSRFCLGVQWHPERTDDAAVGQQVFDRLVAAARQWRLSRRSGLG
jgi:putative glutamine amidotransferase